MIDTLEEMSNWLVDSLSERKRGLEGKMIRQVDVWIKANGEVRHKTEMRIFYVEERDSNYASVQNLTNQAAFSLINGR